jgi:hypothetical protein
MAVRSAIQYIAQNIIRELGLGCYVPASVSSGATSMRVMDVRIFDPAGGQLFVEDIDNLITYTGINADTLTGIPSSSTGSISATINPYTSASRDLVYRGDLISAYELEILIDRYRRWVDGVEVFADVERKRYTQKNIDRVKRPVFGWFDTDVSLRDDNDDSFNAVVATTVNYENGTFEFGSQQTYEVLYVSGWTYNPYFSIADFIETFANDSRWLSSFSAGQLGERQEPADKIAARWRQRGISLQVE